MPHNEFVQKFVKIIGPFYEYVDEDEHEDEDDAEETNDENLLTKSSELIDMPKSMTQSNMSASYDMLTSVNMTNGLNGVKHDLDLTSEATAAALGSSFKNTQIKHENGNGLNGHAKNSNGDLNNGRSNNHLNANGNGNGLSKNESGNLSRINKTLNNKF
jgi:hypothetical protein